MSQKKQLALFLAFFLSIIYLSCFFIASFFGHTFDLSFIEKITLSTIIFCCAASYLIGGQSAHRKRHVISKGFGGLSLGLMSIAFSISAIGYIAIFIGIPALLVGKIGIVTLLLGGIIGLCFSYRQPPIIRHTLRIGKSNQHLRVVQISDLHINGLKHQTWTKNLITRINNLNADIIVFTGDLADVQTHHAQTQLQLLKALEAPKGKFAVSGNHDFYNGYTVFQDMLDIIGFTLIDNRYIEVNNLCIAGISDQDGKRFGYPRPAISDILQNTNKNYPILLLDHRPDHFKKNVREGVSLQLSGHTHGGQLPPWNLIIKLWYTFSAGLYSFDGSQIYISKGTGTWGPPLRLFAHSEVTCFDLTY
jgi:uncharacterized protein